MKGKIIINATVIWFEGTGKTIPLNSILEFSTISDFKMRNVIIWHWFIKNLVGTWRRCDVVTSHRRHYVICLLGIWPPQYSKPWPPQYSKPSYAYAINALALINPPPPPHPCLKMPFALKDASSLIKVPCFFFWQKMILYKLVWLPVCFFGCLSSCLKLGLLLNERICSRRSTRSTG